MFGRGISGPHGPSVNSMCISSWNTFLFVCGCFHGNGEQIPLHVSTTQPRQHIELCTSVGNSRSLQLSYTNL